MYQRTMEPNQAMNAILSRRKAIREEIARLESEDAELQIAERVIERLGRSIDEGVASETAASSAGDHPSSEARSRRPRPPLKEMIIEYLTRTPELWRTANDIQFNVSDMKGADVPMSSISPTLSDLKKSGHIVRNGMQVALAVRVQREQPDFFNENGPPEGDPETGEPDRSPIETQSRDSAVE
jgi:hypothetical protein